VPAVIIVQPVNNSVAIDPNITVSVQISNFNIVDKSSGPNANGEGHLIYYLDVINVPTSPGQPAATAQGTYVSSIATSYQWPDLPDGVHVLSVQLVNNDNTPLVPPIVVKVSISVFTG
jgi:hypothetical protein